MRSVFVVICALFLLGCKSSHVAQWPTQPSAQPSKPVVTPDFRPNGWVQAVNPEARFIIVRFPLTNVAPVGTQLGIYRDGLKVGVAKVTGPEREGNTVADIISGEAREQDQVHQE